MKRLICIAVILSFVFGASMASAYPLVDLAFLRAENYTLVNINADGLGYVANVKAGNYILKVKTPSGSGNPYIEYSGYCVEPAYASYSPLQYELLPIVEGSRFEAAAWILSQGYTTQAPEAQAAIWELIWDTDYDLDNGNFILYSSSPTNEAVKAIYDAALLSMGAGFNQSGYVIAHNPVGSTGWEYSQDYIIPNPVPLPGSLLLLGSGLVGLGLMGRRRRKTGG